MAWVSKNLLIKMREKKKIAGSGRRDEWPGKNTGMPSGNAEMGSGKPRLSNGTELGDGCEK